MQDLFAVQTLSPEGDLSLDHRRQAMVSMMPIPTDEETAIEEFLRFNMHPMFVSHVIHVLNKKKKLPSIASARVAAKLDEMFEVNKEWALYVTDGMVDAGFFGGPVSETEALLRLPTPLLLVAARVTHVEWDPPAQCTVCCRLILEDRMDEAAALLPNIPFGAVALMLMTKSPDGAANNRVAHMRQSSLAFMLSCIVSMNPDKRLEEALRTAGPRALGLSFGNSLATTKPELNEPGADGGLGSGETNHT